MFATGLKVVNTSDDERNQTVIVVEIIRMARFCSCKAITARQYNALKTLKKQLKYLVEADRSVANSDLLNELSQLKSTSGGRLFYALITR